MKMLTTPPSISPDAKTVSELSATNGEPEMQATDVEALPKAPPWALFLIFLAGILLVLALYGWSVRSVPVFVASVMVGTAALVIGALFGFLFGIPRGPADATDAATATASTDYRPSNSLEQVSEWLTKILVGAGLVQLAQIKTALSSLGGAVAGSLSAPPPGTALVSQLVAIVFVVYGFLISFLWTRLYYSQLQTNIDRNLRTVLATEIKKKEQYRSLASQLATGAITTPNTSTTSTKEFRLDTSEMSEWPDEVRKKFHEFKTAPVNWNDDTASRVFRVTTNAANGKVLEAQCDADLRRSVAVTLRVRSTTSTPLDSRVTFCLHPSFSTPVIEVDPIGDRAETKIVASEWFTVVAILDNGNTVLAYDLRKMPNAPAWFKRP